MEIKTKKKRRSGIIGGAIIAAVVIIVVMIVLYCSSDGYKRKTLMQNYFETVETESYAAHALGGIDGYSYTDSKEAFEAAYADGFRLFEVDISITSDDELVCCHGWSERDYEERLGLAYDENTAVMSLEEFQNTKIQGQYTSLTFSDFVELLHSHEDVYCMIDLYQRSYEETLWIYQKIYEECDGDATVLNRLIAGGRTTDMIDAVKEVYDFPLLNLYWSSDKTRQEKIYEKDDFLAYCEENGITSLSVSSTVWTEEWSQYMGEQLIIYVFTIDDEENAATVLKAADVVGTNFLRE